ncbi:MAG TPA: lipopolysaccharide kinase InaA family protein [Candidatus Hydrogenedentes bacterium]|nr:lipopolysaccharide kinase InaA family protein [Candidatus Hydrogenedentota bacterium]HNT87208.1 lipopolysaccharide kinase InaA family protein [Candidatus Hydrogenedentota bacterium]
MIEGFTRIARGGKTALVRGEWAECVAAALLEGVGCIDAGLGGRGMLRVFPYPQGEGVIRRGLRGGLLRHFLHEGYLLANRPLRELTLLWELYREGFAVPEPLGAVWERRGPWLRGAIATHRVDAVDLKAFLRAAPVDRNREQAAQAADADEVLRRCGRLIRDLHDRGVWHADLQVGNVLVGESREYLIDFDKAVRYPMLSARLRASNLERLARSFRKQRLPMRYFQVLLDGYDPASAGIDRFSRKPQ